METVRTVGIKHLKDNLSAYIREMRRGSRILVTDRDRVVAELREPSGTDRTVSEDSPLGQWIREGKVRPPLRSGRAVWPPSPVRFSDGTAGSLLDEDRGE